MKLIRQISTTRELLFSEGVRAASGEASKLVLLPCEREVIWKGFGVCLNESGIAALDTLSERDRACILDELFLPDRMNLNFCRLPIGANDYALGWYSCDETDGDYALSDFSIDRDKKYVLRFAKEALSRNHEIEFFASSWSPPSWMKEPPRYAGGRIREDEETLSAYADYLVRFVNAYREEGVRISMLTPQNEWASDNNYPTCLWSGETMRRFVADFLGPKMEADAPDVSLCLGTINGTGTLGGFGSRYNEYTQAVLDDPRAYRYVRAVAYQWEGRRALRPSVESYPELFYLQSENECGDGSNSWEYANYVFELMREYISGGVGAYVYWNPVLPAGGESTWGWKQNSMITVSGGKVRFEYEYFVFRHAAAFVQRGARVLRLGGRMSGNAFAFQNADGSIVLAVQNPFAYEKAISFCGEVVSLAPQSITSLVFKT